ncbi:MAG: choice-of-anchor Q domain-containing protein [Acidimicrobiia bacterium]
MGLRISRRALSALAVVAMAVVPVAVVSFSAPAGAAGATTAGSAAALKAAWIDSSTTAITLTANITISGGDCSGGYVRSSGSGIVVDGQGQFGVTNGCGGGRILIDDSDESVTLTGLTHFDGGDACGAGGGLFADGNVDVVDSSFSNDITSDCACSVQDAVAACVTGDVHGQFVIPVAGGAIFSGSDLTITGSTFSGNHADEAGGAVYALGTLQVSGSSFTGNSAGTTGNGQFWAGAAGADGSVDVTGSTFTGNWLGTADGDECVGCLIAGGAVAAGVQVNQVSSASAPPVATISGSTFTGNHADCVTQCIAEAGAVGAYMVDLSASSFTGNSADILDCDSALSEGNLNCQALGGAVVGLFVEDAGSTFSGNHADGGSCVNANCFLEGGAIASEVGATLSNSSITGNHAQCHGSCLAVGGGVAVGALGSAGAAADGAGPLLGSQAQASVTPDDSVSISQSNISDNTVGCDTDSCEAGGGGVFAIDASSYTITASTLSGNVAPFGAAMYASADSDVPVTIVNSTVTGNEGNYSGALALDAGPVSLAYDTIVGNIVTPVQGTSSSSVRALAEQAGLSLHGAAVEAPLAANLTAQDGPVTTFGTIVALPQGGVNCDILNTSAPPTSQGYNWSDDTSCQFTNATDLVAMPNDPQLNALGDWGGPTPTMLPVTPKFGGAISPVIDAIPVAACQTGIAAGITTDQRGATRPSMNGCEIGAVEVTLEDYQVEALVVTPKFTG